jgi:hypothetical protein
MRDRHCAHCSPVKRAAEGDDHRFTLASMLAGILARKLERALVGLGTAVAEKHAVGKRAFDQQPG